ncbi:hypothetical protein DL96DRAFT_1707137 [Flagelloscypha sp. PMI_526]|nr:hypothetical protein DL96DRAFT_1707137 [Flagelloscypha sp. PMI_526]
MSLFEGVAFYLAPTLRPKQKDHIHKLLTSQGAKDASLEDATHIISDSDIFHNYEAVSEGSHVVTPAWVTRSIERGFLEQVKYFLAGPNHLFSGMTVCSPDIPRYELDIISCVIAALGGQWRTGFTKDVTHLLAYEYNDKVIDAASKSSNVHFIHPRWFYDTLRFFLPLPTEPFSWPNPPFLSLKSGDSASGTTSDGDSSEVSQLHMQLLKTALKDPVLIDKLETRTPRLFIWQSDCVLISPSYGLRGSKKIAFEQALVNADAQVVQYNSDVNEEEEADLVELCDIFITPFEKARAYDRAIELGKQVATMNWMFYVQATGHRSDPRNQLLHYPIRRHPIPNITFTLTNYTGDAREYLKRLIQTMGGDFTANLTRNTTVVIASQLAGEKVLKAQSWSIPIIMVTSGQYSEFPPGIDFCSLLAKRGYDRPLEDIESNDTVVQSSDPEDVEMPSPATFDSAKDEAEVENIVEDQSDTGGVPADEVRDAVLNSSPIKSSPMKKYRSSAKRNRKETHSGIRRRISNTSPIIFSSAPLGIDKRQPIQPAHQKMKTRLPRNPAVSLMSMANGDRQRWQMHPYLHAPTQMTELEPIDSFVTQLPPARRNPPKIRASGLPVKKMVVNYPLPQTNPKRGSTSRSSISRKVLTKSSADNDNILSTSSSSSSSRTATPESGPEARLRRGAATKADSNLKTTMQDVIKYEKERRSRNFVKVGATQDDYIDSSTAKKKRKSSGTPSAEVDGLPLKRIKSENGSPKPTKSRAESTSKRVAIFSTGWDDTTAKSFENVRQLGGKLTDNPEIATHLVIPTFRRSARILTALSLFGVVDLSPDNISAEEDYLFKDPAAEKKFNFRIQDALTAAKKRKAESKPKLFKTKYFVNITADGQKDGDKDISQVLKATIESFGGKSVPSRNRMPLDRDGHYLSFVKERSTRISRAVQSEDLYPRACVEECIAAAMGCG